MKTIALTILLTLGFTCGIFAQNFAFLESISNTFNPTPPVIATDPQGNTYVAGNYWYDLSIDGLSVTSDAYMSTFIAKYNKYGNIIWLKSITATEYVYTYEITFNKVTKGIVVCGAFAGTLNIGPDAHTSEGETDGFWISYDNFGNVLANNTSGGTGDDAYQDIGTDKAGNIYVAGEFNSSSMFFGGALQLMSPTNFTGAIAKFTAAGSPVWMRTITSDDFVALNCMDVAANGTTYFAFNATGSYYLNNGPDETYGVINDADKKNIVVYALTKQGDLYQSTEFPINDHSTRTADIVYDGSVNIALNVADSIEINGEYYAPEDFEMHLLVMRLSAVGFDIEWIKYFTSTYSITASTIKSINGDILVAGRYFEYAALEGLTVENPFSDAESYLATIDAPSGTTLGFADFDNVESNDLITDMDADKNGNIYITGLYQGDLYFDAMHTTSLPLYYDIFLTRLNATILREEEHINQIANQLYPNPATTQINLNEVVTSWHIINMQGETVLTCPDNTPTSSIDSTLLPAGIYLLSYINTNNQLASSQFVKQ